VILRNIPSGDVNRMVKGLQYVFGPLHSWRLGRSLGVDPISTKSKICNMNCVYCQLGKTARLTDERKIFVPTGDVLAEICCVPLRGVDHITFAGRGEPTLALNLGEMIRGVKAIRHEKIAVLTNSSLMHLKEVRDDLMAADYVLAKLDAGNQTCFDAVDQGRELDLDKIIHGIMDFRESFKGKLAIQIMLVEQNIKNIRQIAQVARRLGANEIQLDTPLRPSAVKPLERRRVQRAKKCFEDMPVVSVFDAPLQEYTPIDAKATIKRHGNYLKTRYTS
jgi:wyosine [tRNA(Phe)-imidazoG37] synthetase (radical SAM superfamily)